MKLIRFTAAHSPSPCFGVVVRDQAVPFAVLQSRAAKSSLHVVGRQPILPRQSYRQRAGGEEAVRPGYPIAMVCLCCLHEFSPRRDTDSSGGFSALSSRNPNLDKASRGARCDRTPAEPTLSPSLQLFAAMRLMLSFQSSLFSSVRTRMILRCMNLEDRFSGTTTMYTPIVGEGERS
jgi:hypothetical protein